MHKKHREEDYKGKIFFGTKILHNVFYQIVCYFTVSKPLIKKTLALTGTRMAKGGITVHNKSMGEEKRMPNVITIY